MIKRIILLWLLAYLLTPDIFSQEYTFPQLKGFKILSDYPVYTRDNLWDFIDGAADNYLSLGFQDLNVVEYKKGRNIIKLEIYRHRNNTEAFGIYSSERSPSFRFIKIGAQGYRVNGSLNFYKGDFYVKIRTGSKSEKILRSLETLAIRTADMLPGESVLPAILAEFPEAGKQRNEEVYIKEGVLGHEFLQGAFKANYKSNDNNFSIFILDKDSEEETRKIVTDYLSREEIEIDDPAGGKYVFKDGYNGDIFLAWKEKRIIIIQGLQKDQTELANRYASEILR
jgi:hypothetical protein